MTVEYEGMYFVSWLIKLFIFQQISHYKLGWKLFLAIPLFFTLIEYFDYNIVFFAEPLFLPLILLLVKHFKTNWNWSQYLFYSLFPYAIDDVFTRIADIYLRFSLNLTIEEWRNFAWSDLILVLLVVPFYWGFVKLINLDVYEITKRKKYKKIEIITNVLNISLILYIFMMHVLSSLPGLESEGWVKLNINYIYCRIQLVSLYLLFLLGILLYLNYNFRRYQAQELSSQKDQQLKPLSEYSHHIESLYQEIRSFRHDYTNVLVSLNESIKAKDIDSVEKVYHSVLENTDKKFYQGKYDIANLSNLQNDAIKSIVSTKLLKANNMGVDISVEIPEVISSPNIEILDFITILSIFLDNAIEASVLAKKPSLTLAYFEDRGQQLLVIENSTKISKINTKTIFKRGFSSKGDNRGIGLANVKEILDKYDNVILNTTSADYQFRQEMKVG